MPYNIEGWIEVLWDCTLADEPQKWSSVINLERFCLQSDSVTNWLFGLAKQPLPEAYFANRGVPQDCSSCVANEIERNDQFIEQYGEGDISRWAEINVK
jgi:hypothetical protein